MAELYNFGKKVTLEEYVREEVAANYGASTRIQTYMLHDILDNCNVEYKQSATKNDLLDLMYQHFRDWNKIAEVLRIGVKVNQYLDAFTFVTKADIKRLEKFKQLKVIDKQRFRLYGAYRYFTIYDLTQYQNMTEQYMRDLLNQFPKGKRK